MPVDGFKFYRLSKNLHRAIDTAKDILKYGIRKEHLQAKLSVKTEGVQHETSLIFLRKENPEKVDQLKNELVARFPDVDFDEILLLVTKLARRRVKCANCGKEMQSNNLTRHLKSCVKGQYCPVCQKEVQGDLQQHIDRCCRKSYSCNICGHSFNTGARRTAHQKKCQRKTYDCNICGESFNTQATRTSHQKERHKKTYDCGVCGELFNTATERAAHEKKCGVADDKTLPQGSRDGAIGGLFSIVTIEPKIKSFDYDGIMEDEVDHIAEILDDRMVTALKFYISIELEMSRLTDDTIKIVTFQTRSSTLLKTMDAVTEVKEHIKLIDSKIDKYIRNGSGWTVESVRVINVMMTKFNPI